MRQIKIKTNKYYRALANKRGDEMVEAAISLPLILLTTILLIRLFTFYLEILNTSVACHVDALERQDNYSGLGMQVYADTEEIKLLKGDLLLSDVSKELKIKAYMLNEDLLVRAGEIGK